MGQSFFSVTFTSVTAFSYSLAGSTEWFTDSTSLGSGTPPYVKLIGPTGTIYNAQIGPPWGQTVGFSTNGVLEAGSYTLSARVLAQYYHGANAHFDFTLGTAPFAITTITREGDDIRVAWVTAGGQTNFVQAMADPDTNFVDLSAAIVATNSDVISTNYLDPGAVTNFPARLYRVRVIP